MLVGGKRLVQPRHIGKAKALGFIPKRQEKKKKIEEDATGS